MGDACNGPNFISMSGANKGIKMVRELIKLCKICPNLDYLYQNYESRIEYILTDTWQNMLNYSLVPEITDNLKQQYTEFELNQIGILHNIYLNDLVVTEKCHILTHLFISNHLLLMERELSELNTKLLCRSQVLLEKRSRPLSLSLLCLNFRYRRSWNHERKYIF